MKILTLLVLCWSPLAFAHIDCEYALAYVHSHDGIYIDRWALPPNVKREELMNTLINDVAAGVPIVIYDTNPNAALWAESNIVRPSDDQRFSAEGYEDLSVEDKHLLFSEYLDRADETLTSVTRPILIIDHHFDSRLLAATSATPLTIDFLGWLSRQDASPAVDRVRAAFARGTALRDHSDADIVLANFAGRLAERPEDLARWGPLMRAIALYNDHAELPAGGSPRERNRVLLGYALLNAFEAHIEEHPSGGFDFALQYLPATFDLIDAAVADFGDAEDVVATFLDSRLAADLPPEFESLLRSVRFDWERGQALTHKIRGMLQSGHGVRRAGGTLIIDLPSQPKAASGLAIMRLVEASNAPLTVGARTLVAITREPSSNGPVTHVKMRALAPDVNFDAVLAEIRARGFGGGGRGRAAGLYASSGRVVNEADLARDVEWLIERL